VSTNEQPNTATCPACGASLQGAKTCWLCGRVLRPISEQHQGDSVAWAVVGVLALLVCASLMREQPSWAHCSRKSPQDLNCFIRFATKWGQSLATVSPA